MVFVHGFNNRFDDAAYRLAQFDQGETSCRPVHDAWQVILAGLMIERREMKASIGTFFRSALIPGIQEREALGYLRLLSNLRRQTRIARGACACPYFVLG
jgi:hypothetical protein